MTDPTTLPVRRAADLDIEPEHRRWLIDGVWSRAAIGLIGGAPKCAKTWLGLDLAVSVASGTPALGVFSIAPGAKGPALVYLAEDALPQVRERIESLCRHRGLDIDRLDLHVITAASLRLDQADDQRRLARTIELVQPHLVLLDPLVRMHRLDENSAAEISGLLGYIRDLQRRFDVAIALVHHASKKQRAQPGQALRGSSDLHAIGDSNAYLARKGEHLVLTLEHRAAASPDPMILELVAGDDSTHLRVRGGATSLEGRSAPSLDQRVLDHLAGLRQAVSRTELRTHLKVNNQRLGESLHRLEREGQIRRSSSGWSSRTNKPGETEVGFAGMQPTEG